MSQPTFEKFNYALRPAKHVERRMLCELIARMSRIQRMCEYRYVGFGSLSFVDFRLFYRRLGLRHMASIERRVGEKARIDFNRPYGGIEMHWKDADDAIPEIPFESFRSIVWLDFDSPLNGNMLTTIGNLLTRITSGSALFVTVCVDPGEDGSGPTAPQQRLERLIGRVGKRRLPGDTNAGDLAGWGLARVCREIINNEIVATIAQRNGPLDEAERVEYQQMVNFHYADGAKMLTVGGFFLNSADQKALSLEWFDELDFVRTAGDEYSIEIPVLTWRETVHLDKILSVAENGEGDCEWLPQHEREKYEKISRFAATYLDVEL